MGKFTFDQIFEALIQLFLMSILVGMAWAALVDAFKWLISYAKRKL